MNPESPASLNRRLLLLGLLSGFVLTFASAAQAACDGVPLIALAKSADKSTVAPGENVTFTYQLSNLAGMPLMGVTITDDNGTPDSPADDVLITSIPFFDTGQTLQFTRTTPMPLAAGAYTNTACAFTTIFGLLPVAATASAVVTVEVAAPPPPDNPPPTNEPPTNPGVLGQGYWKNHPDEWPLTEVKLGAATYPKAQALDFMHSIPKQGDKTQNLLQQLIAAKLNVAAGNDPACVQPAITDTDDFLVLFPPGMVVKANSPAWKAISPEFETLAAYNEGLLCVPSRR